MPRDYQKLELVKEKNDLKINKETLQENTGSLKGKLLPTDIGLLVTDYLMENFTRVMDYSFTAEMEKDFDEIAEGHKEWTKALKLFYTPFHKEIEASAEDKEYVTGERALGNDPKTGKPVIAKLGRYGPMIQIGVLEDEEKPKYAKLQSGQSIETISLEDAMTLFNLPRDLGEIEGKKVRTSIGRFGPYIQVGPTFVSLKKEDDPYTITLNRALELYELKMEADANRLIQDFGDIQVLNGRWGPYISKGKENYKIPKGTDAKTLTLDEIENIITNSVDKPKKKFPKKK